MTLVLDAGALIQVDRGNQEVLSALKVAFDKGEVPGVSFDQIRVATETGWTIPYIV